MRTFEPDCSLGRRRVGAAGADLNRTTLVIIAAVLLAAGLLLQVATLLEVSGLSAASVSWSVLGVLALAIGLLLVGLRGRPGAGELSPPSRQDTGELELARGLLELMATADAQAVLLVEEGTWVIHGCNTGLRTLMSPEGRPAAGANLAQMAGTDAFAAQLFGAVRSVDDHPVENEGVFYDVSKHRVVVAGRVVIRMELEPREEAHIEALLNRNVELRRARKELESQNDALRGAEEVRRRLLANVSHDLRTPLVSMRGYAELLAKGGLGEITERQRKGVQTMLRNLDRLLAMIEDLLQFGEMNRGEATLKADVFDLADLARDVVELAHAQAQENRINLRLRVQPPTDGTIGVMVHADRIRLNRVLLNLVGNAIKFTPPGGKVRVYLRSADQDEVAHLEHTVQAAAGADSSGGWMAAGRAGSWVLLRVLDTGCGIPTKDLDRVFGWGNTLGHSGSASGLGLAITDEIVRLHGGLIELQSEVGEGTVFSVWLPVGRPGAAPPPARTSGAIRARGTRARVLIVDDEHDILEFAAEVLEQAGYEIRTAAEVEQVWTIVGSWRPDAIVVDYTLRGVEGDELIGQLKAHARLALVPVGVLSAHAAREVKDKCLAAGARAYLRKPFSLDDLTEFVGNLVPSDLPPPPKPRVTGTVSMAARRGPRDTPSPT